MNPTPRPTTSWRQLQTELRELAFVLDRTGCHEAADVAVTIAARIGEVLAGEVKAGGLPLREGGWAGADFASVDPPCSNAAKVAARGGG